MIFEHQTYKRDETPLIYAGLTITGFTIVSILHWLGTITDLLAATIN